MRFLLLFKSTFLILVYTLFFSLQSCLSQNKSSQNIITGANQIEEYFPFIKNKKIAVVANQTSVISTSRGYTHLVDSLQALNINIVKVFSPEHGFRGKADAAEVVKDGVDTKTGIPIISLYGKNKKPKPEQVKGIDCIIFDIQDVGVRFYTYISTLHYVMESCAENNIPLIVLDRPNPNSHYIDGPTLNIKYKSFVGMHPVPLVYGLTIGEYAQMINGRGWLAKKVKCNLTVILLENYTHLTPYHLPIRPSPNLPNDKAINLYPSLGFFEGTTINAGRGTEFQFQRYGSSDFPKSNFSYIPQPNFGSKYPKHKGKLCYGVDLAKTLKQNKVNLTWLLDAYKKSPNKKDFFGKTFTIHAGDTILETQIKKGLSADEIKKSWRKGIRKFKKNRNKYLLYP